MGDLAPLRAHPLPAPAGLRLRRARGAAGLVFWWDPVIATHRLVPSLLLIAFAVLGTEMLRRQVIRELPDHVTPGSPSGAGQGIADRIREPRVATAGAPSAAASADPRVGEIERLAGLRDSGALTDDEFAAEKARILGSA